MRHHGIGLSLVSKEEERKISRRKITDMRRTRQQIKTLLGVMSMSLIVSSCNFEGDVKGLRNNSTDNDSLNPDIEELNAEPTSRNSGKQNAIALYQKNCANCHGDLEVSNVRGLSAGQISDAISRIPAMKHLSILSEKEISDIAIALEVKPDDTLEAIEDPQLKLGVELYQNHCASCHLNYEKSDKKNRSKQDIQSAIANEPQMTRLGNLTSKEIEAISYALNYGGETKATKFTLPLGTRKLIASQLSYSFLPEGAFNAVDQEIQTLIEENVTKKPDVFGGTCSRYDTVHKSSNADVDRCYVKDGNREKDQVSLASIVLSSMTPQSNVLRSGYQTRICEDILNYDKAVLNLLDKIALSASSPRNMQNIRKVFDFASPGKPINAETMTSMRDIATKTSELNMSDVDSWRFLILPVCIYEMGGVL